MAFLEGFAATTFFIVQLGLLWQARRSFSTWANPVSLAVGALTSAVGANLLVPDISHPGSGTWAVLIAGSVLANCGIILGFDAAKTWVPKPLPVSRRRRRDRVPWSIVVAAALVLLVFLLQNRRKILEPLSANGPLAAQYTLYSEYTSGAFWSFPGIESIFILAAVASALIGNRRAFAITILGLLVGTWTLVTGTRTTLVLCGASFLIARAINIPAPKRQNLKFAPFAVTALVLIIIALVSAGRAEEGSEDTGTNLRSPTYNALLHVGGGVASLSQTIDFASAPAHDAVPGAYSLGPGLRSVCKGVSGDCSEDELPRKLPVAYIPFSWQSGTYLRALWLDGKWIGATIGPALVGLASGVTWRMASMGYRCATYLTVSIALVWVMSFHFFLPSTAVFWPLLMASLALAAMGLPRRAARAE